MRTPVAVGPAQAAITAGLLAIREQFGAGGEFPEEVIQAAEAAAMRRPGREHADRTDVGFVTLDPAASTDLDQAFAIDRQGPDLRVRYAIADIAWFVDPGDPVDAEAWRRGSTIYLPDGRVPLYPAVLGEGAASLLPDVDRPAVVFDVRVDPDGEARLAGVERALVRSRTKLAYESVGPADMPEHLTEVARRVGAAEARRGAHRVDTPEQRVVVDEAQRYHVVSRARTAAEDANAALSLAANLAVAQLLLKAGVGLFRVMPEPDERAVRRLRHTARALGLRWPAGMSLAEVERTLRPGDPASDAFAVAVRRAGGGAGYAALGAAEGVPDGGTVAVPWHAAIAAPYVHATAPLRRLADRYVVLAALAVANGRAVPAEVGAAFAALPELMRRADGRAAQIDRAVVDLVEAAMLSSRVGEVFDAVVTDTDDRGARFQLADLAVVARVAADGMAPGDRLRVRVASVDLVGRQVRFERA